MKDHEADREADHDEEESKKRDHGIEGNLKLLIIIIFSIKDRKGGR